MDVLISANQPVLDFARAASEALSLDMDKQEFQKWLEKMDAMDKVELNEECL